MILKGLCAVEDIAGFPHVDSAAAGPLTSVGDDADVADEAEVTAGSPTVTTSAATSAAVGSVVDSGTGTDVLAVRTPSACPPVVLAVMASCHSLVLQPMGPATPSFVGALN